MLKNSKMGRMYTGHIDCVFSVVVAVVILTINPLCAWAETPKKSPATPVQTGANVFSQIAEDGLSGTVSSGNLSVIKSACDQAHSDPDGSDWADDTVDGVRKVFKFVDRQTSRILNLAATADGNSEDRAKALFHIGLVLRALEEFYLKSNYVELKIDSAQGGAKSFDPYNIEPLNWTKVGKDDRSIAIEGFKFGGCDKSTAKLPEGAKKLDNATYFSMSKELAVKETLREWNTLERLIRVRYPQKAAEIMVALKTASCPANFKPDGDD